jgi:flagellar protein FliO/FliZ
MFGDWGALLLQFVITAVVVLGLVAVVFWLVRRYSAAGLGRIGRGRVPRLAIIDAMSVDGRRKLVLVRRDNVEHLLLIGGPSDVVVEQTIQRPRRPKTAPESGETEPAQPLSGARTFSFRRPTPAEPASQPPPGRRSDEPAHAPSPARFVDVQRPTLIEPAAKASPQPVDESEPLFPELPTADLPIDDIAPPPVPNGDDPRQSHFDLGDASPAAQPAISPYAKQNPDSGGRGGNLADLENEMARLLGEITQKRPS